MACGRLHLTGCVLVCAGVMADAASGGTIALAAQRDATLYESADGSIANGAGQYLFAGRTNQAPVGALRRSVIQFNLAGAIPDGAEIVAARLVMNLSQLNGGEAQVSLHRSLSAWTSGSSDPSGGEGSGAAATAGDATWIHSSWSGPASGSFWNAAGGDYAAAASASVTTAATGLYTWSSAGLLSDVRAFAAAPSLNFGWFIIGPETTMGVTRRFDSSESASIGGIAPRLEVEWTVVPAPASALALLCGLAPARRRRR